MKKVTVLALLLSVLTVAPFERTIATTLPQATSSLVADTLTGRDPVRISYTTNLAIDPVSSRVVEVRGYTNPVFRKAVYPDHIVGSGIAVTRYDVNGNPDPTFGSGGRVLLPSVQEESVVGAGFTSSGKLIIVVFAFYPGLTYRVLRLNNDGSVDNSFGTAGYVDLPPDAFGIGGFANAAHVYPDGRVLIAGVADVTSTDGDEFARVMRLTATGQPDTGFSGDGIVDYDFAPADWEMFRGVTVDPSSRVVLVGEVESASTNEVDSLVARLDSNGGFDASFGSGGTGVRLIDLSPGQNDTFNAVVVTGSGRIVAVGSDDATGESLVAGLSGTTGELDNTFATGGVNRANPAGFGDISYGYTIAGSPAGLLVTGSSGGEFFVQRLTLSGVAEPSFNAGAILELPNGGSAWGSDAVFDSSGRILVGQRRLYLSGTSVTRLTVAGALDTSWSTDGVTADNFGSFVQFDAIARLGNGQLLAAGSVFENSLRTMVLARVRPDGTFDESFGTEGLRAIDFGTGTTAYVTTAATQADGKVLFAGRTTSSVTGPRLVVLRFGVDGELDPSFAGDGIASVDLSADGTISTVSSVVVQTDGRILVTGDGDGSSGPALFVARLETDGDPDTTFSTDGFSFASLPGSPSVSAVGIHEIPNGKIMVVAGAGLFGADQVATIRLSSDGQPDPTYDTDGIATTTWPGATGLDLVGSALQSDGRVVVAGSFYNVNNYDSFVTRISTTGALDTTFGSNGLRFVDVTSGGFEYASSLQVDPLDRLYFVGGLGERRVFLTDTTAQSYPNDSDIIVARFTPNGSFDTTFDELGWWTVEIGNDSNDVALSSHLDPGGTLWISGATHDLATAATNGLLVRVGGPAFVPVSPSRIMDTRDGTGGITANKVGNGTNDQGTILEFDVRGKGGLPTDATQIGAVSLNVTAANTTAPNEGGWVAVYPCGTTPNVSNLNFTNGQITPNAVITPISTTGKICFKVYGRTDIIVDINGWFQA